jgi:hypothetical protein
MSKAAKNYKHKPLIMLHGLPPFMAWKSLPTGWPATIETAVVLARKVFAMQGRQH